MAENIQEFNLSGNDAGIVKRKSPLSILANRDFRLLWLGESISLLGDQFYLIALPWLTLQLTGSGLALGTVLMVAGIPRALFMLVGGAIVDRISPRIIMRDTNLLRLALTLVLTALVLLHALQFWMLYLFAFAFGLVDAFFHPAYMALVPRLVRSDDLQSSNAILQGTGQIMNFVGPAPAGLLIAVVGAGAAFGVDAVTFLIAALAAQLIRGGNRLPSAGGIASESAEPIGVGAVLKSIREGLAAVRSDAVLPTMLLVVAGLNFFFGGTFGVGIPALARDRFVDGAAGMGTVLSVFGGGALLGVLLAGVLHPRRIGYVIMSSMGLAGIGMAALGFAQTVLVAAAVSGLVGVCVGFTNVLAIAWLQRRAAPEILGRVMSLVMLAANGLIPFSNALAGVLVDVNLTLLFAGAGVSVVLLSIWAILNPAVRLME